YGFNAEFGVDVSYDGCHSGGRASDQADGLAGFTTNQDLGNTSAGFTSLASKRVTYTGVHSTDNTGDGLLVASADGVASEVHVNGGVFTANAEVGINFLHADSVTGSSISPSTQLGGNTNAELSLPVIGYITNTKSILATPTVPVSGVALVNPFPFAVNIILTNTNTYYMQIGAVNIGMAAAGNHTIPLPRGASITANYGAAPTWIWIRA
ncbi:MAG: hypothetical protein M3Q75_13830, partial [Gemmatimonadota bacterium]|nr:hypothetical protein [Gemmatimonadota bacterium]